MIRPNSGQNIQDANLIKMRITHGYEPKVPLLRSVYAVYLAWLDTGTDDFTTQLIRQGRIPVDTHVTLQMQSDAFEQDPVSMPGMGNNGNPVEFAPRPAAARSARARAVATAAIAMGRVAR
ncbi:hypothetical protein [Actimicrobium antarcticum]|uniref:Uncharacterized protein n=1 Tax=Actimicrobium antarcticum TaxID=1051899 RepID=A0ABP7TPE6_9BURK